MEFFENVLPINRRDARSSVGHRYKEVLIASLYLDRHFARFGEQRHVVDFERGAAAHAGLAFDGEQASGGSGGAAAHFEARAAEAAEEFGEGGALADGKAEVGEAAVERTEGTSRLVRTRMVSAASSAATVPASRSCRRSTIT